MPFRTHTHTHLQELARISPPLYQITTPCPQHSPTNHFHVCVRVCVRIAVNESVKQAWKLWVQILAAINPKLLEGRLALK